MFRHNIRQQTSISAPSSVAHVFKSLLASPCSYASVFVSARILRSLKKVQPKIQYVRVWKEPSKSWAKHVTVPERSTLFLVSSFCNGLFLAIWVLTSDVSLPSECWRSLNAMMLSVLKKKKFMEATLPNLLVWRTWQDCHVWTGIASNEIVVGKRNQLCLLIYN
jgi:hypothetical protein